MLRDCPECQGKVSSDADACPHCGYRLRGREHMIQCPSCNQTVIPVFSPHDSIRKYCPLCAKPITGQGCGMIAVAVPIVIVGIAVALLIGGCAVLKGFLVRSASPVILEKSARPGPEPAPGSPDAPKVEME